jgi:hypothetical protein
MFRFFQGSKRSRPKTTKPPAWRPTLEVLEARTLLDAANPVVTAAPVTLRYTYVNDSGDSLTGGFTITADSAPASYVHLNGSFGFSSPALGPMGGRLPDTNVAVVVNGDTAYGKEFGLPIDPSTGNFTQAGYFLIDNFTGPHGPLPATMNVFFSPADEAGNLLASWSGRAVGNPVHQGDGHWVVSGLPALATTAALSSDNPGGSVYGQPVTFTATVHAPAGTPTGSVQFQIDGADFGSAVPLTNGVAQIGTALLPVGTHNITAAYTSDSSSFLNSGTASPLVHNVTYGIKVLFDQAQAKHGGSTIPVEIELTDYYGNNLSSPGIGVQALYIVPASNPGVQLPVQSPGNSQPGNDFLFTGGKFRYNLQTAGLADGTYSLYFTVDGEPLVHSVSFVVG